MDIMKSLFGRAKKVEENVDSEPREFVLKKEWESDGPKVRKPKRSGREQREWLKRIRRKKLARISRRKSRR